MKKNTCAEKKHAKDEMNSYSELYELRKNIELFSKRAIQIYNIDTSINISTLSVNRTLFL